MEEFSTEVTSTLKERNINIKEYENKVSNFGKLISISINNVIVGIIAIYMNNKDTREAYISFLAVKEQYHKNGYGRKLLVYSEQLAYNNGMKTIKLEFRSNNIMGMSFYIRNNYLFS